MQVIKLRRISRRVLKVRRLHDRRIVPYAFGSSEWVENIKNHYLARPKDDRRQVSRRCALERRGHDRREQLQYLQKCSSAMLTCNELQLIADLYKCNLEELGRRQ